MSAWDVAWYVGLAVVVAIVLGNVIENVRRKRAEERRLAEQRIRLLEQDIRALQTVVRNHEELFDAVFTGKETESIAVSSGGMRVRRLKQP